MVLISGYEVKVKFCFLVITYIKGEEDQISDLFFDFGFLWAHWSLGQWQP